MENNKKGTRTHFTRRPTEGRAEKVEYGRREGGYRPHREDYSTSRSFDSEQIRSSDPFSLRGEKIQNDSGLIPGFLPLFHVLHGELEGIIKIGSALYRNLFGRQLQRLPGFFLRRGM